MSLRRVFICLSRTVATAGLLTGGLVAGPGSASAAVTQTFIQGTLTINADPGSYRMACGPTAAIQINGVNTSPAVPCDRVEVLIFNLFGATTISNTVDLRGIKLATSPFLRAVEVRSTNGFTVLGTEVADLLQAGGPSVIDGLKGNDDLRALRGSGSIVRGGAGDDRLVASVGVGASLEGGSGNDTIVHSGHGAALGFDGNDLIQVAAFAGLADDVTVDGGVGDDTIDLGRSYLSSSNAVDGGAGFDRLKVRKVNLTSTMSAAPVALGGVETIRVAEGTSSRVFGSVEEVNLRGALQEDDEPSYDVTMSPTTAMVVIIDEDPSRGNVPVLTQVRVPGGIWTVDEAARKVRSPGLKTFRWTRINDSRQINLQVVAA